MTDTLEQRRQLLARLFPGGVPRLWCPTLTHFSAPGELDEERIAQHLAEISPYVKGILVPGSTGEGWEMDDEEARELLDVVLTHARAAGISTLVGVLKTEAEDVLDSIRGTVEWLCRRSERDETAEALRESGVVGFTVCPPKGPDLSQEQITAALKDVLDMGHPVAIYQLPQVTENEMAPETLEDLAGRYANFALFKDSSGEDRVALSDAELPGVFKMRGAEGTYTRWPKSAGGPYDGFLVSTANCFAPQLARMLDLLEHGHTDQARALIVRVERIVEPAFEMVAQFETGNAFTNTNKSFDHVLAWGASWAEHEMPLLYSGQRLPQEFIQQAAEWLHEEQMFPDKGYMK